MGFTEEHDRWLEHHLNRRKGERKSRLERGHGHGERMFLEQVWWPMFGQMQHLHPEYEVADWRGRPYFIDFVWKPGQIKFAIEVKGYGPHVQNMDRTRYRQELNRETFLQIAGFRVVAVPYDDLEANPELTISLLRSLLTPCLVMNSEGESFARLEREIMLVAIRSDGFIRPTDLVHELGVNYRTVIRHVKSLCEKGKLKPIYAGKSSKVCRYEYVHSFKDNQLW
ncbi:MAG: winged helix-turn-helix domain-containing protein [Paenibacillus sp.]|nr:winged helix-turn-helix domain-containing protein [Paenibacillus sp.]